MSKNRTGNNRFLKEFNQAALLDLIRVNGPVSRFQLSAISGLSPTAAGSIVSNLMELGYIHETGAGESSGGRRPVLLELKPHSFYSIGVDIDVGRFGIVLTDITAQVEWSGSITADASVPGKLVKEIAEAVKRVLDQQAIDTSRLLGVGISVPGMVDTETHRVLLAPNLQWEDIDLCGRLGAVLEVPAYIENESMASAVCENWVGSCSDTSNFVCINIGSGIGAGIFTGGRLYRGAGGTAGEVGHIVVNEGGPRCGCGNYGCLETMASTRYIVETARRLVRQGTVSSLNTVEHAEHIDLDLVVKAARDGDETAAGILNDAARYLGIAISSIVNTLNPSKVVIGKEFSKYGDLVMDQLKGMVECKALKVPASRVEILVSSMGDSSSAVGAAILPLKKLFGR